MPFSIVQRLLHTLAPWPMRLSGPMRLEVRPPVAHRSAPRWRRLAAWLSSGTGDPSDSPEFDDWKPMRRDNAELNSARAAFRAALEDIATAEAHESLDHIRSARSLNELWHLRAEVFSLVSRHHNQGEAGRRLSLVDRHFPSRSRRPGFASAPAHDGHESVPPT